MLLMSVVMFACMADIYSRHITMSPGEQQHRRWGWLHVKSHQQQNEPHRHKGSNSHHNGNRVAGSVNRGSNAAASVGGADSGTPQSGGQGHPRSTAVPKASWDEIKAVFHRNPTAAALTVTVVAFSVSYRMFEYSYKHQLRLATADAAAYCCKLADVQSAVGAATIVMMLMSKFVFKVRLAAVWTSRAVSHWPLSSYSAEPAFARGVPVW